MTKNDDNWFVYIRNNIKYQQHKEDIRLIQGNRVILLICNTKYTYFITNSDRISLK